MRAHLARRELGSAALASRTEFVALRETFKFPIPGSCGQRLPAASGLWPSAHMATGEIDATTPRRQHTFSARL
jgi:hypothetical protein